MYGGHLSHAVVRERIIRAFLIEEQKIVKKVRAGAMGPHQPLQQQPVWAATSTGGVVALVALWLVGMQLIHGSVGAPAALHQCCSGSGSMQGICNQLFRLQAAS